jgi:hypothetical protein
MTIRPGEETLLELKYIRRVSCPSTSNPTLTYIPAFLIASPIDMSVVGMKMNLLIGVEYKAYNEASDHFNAVWIDEDENSPSLGTGCTEAMVTG